MVNSLSIYRQGSVIATVDIDESTIFSGKLPGTELISCPLNSLQVLNLQEEDYIIHKGSPYKIRILPEMGKDSASLGNSYRIEFLARFYDLHDTYVQHLGAHVFPYYGTAADHLQLIIDSANLNDTGWVIGTVDVTAAQLLTYDWTFARPSLDQIAEAFGLEWNAVGTTINMVASIGSNTGLVFEFGRGKGLHQITRSSDTSKEKINRVYGIGGSKNIDSTYRNGVFDHLTFNGEYVETPGVTAGTERVREGKYENAEMYPKFEGVVANPVFVTVAGVITSATIQDTNIDFDLMLYLQDGVKAKVSFLTGPVTGVDFEISAFNFATKTITLIPFTDTTGYYFPSATSKPEVGNKFTFIDIRMPSSYIATWEGKLKAETLKFLNDNKSQWLIYSVKPDEKHLRDNLISLKCGDRATAIDADLGVNEILRFTEISYPLVNEYDITGVIGNDIVYNQVAKLFATVQQNTQTITRVSQQGIVNARRAAQNLRTLEGSIFDTDGKFDSAKINVGVLSAALAIIGVKSQNFVLNGVRLTDNFNGNPNAIDITTGQLIHLEYSNPGNANIWTMSALNKTDLISATFYYIYAKCSKSAQVGSWVITTDQIKPDDVVGFYHFLAGLVYPVNGSFRDTELTNGITDITGARIKTGIIQGRTGALVINLETGEITGTLTFKSSGGAYLPVSGVANTANTALSNAASVAANLSTLQAGLGGLAYKSAVELAELGTTVINGGYIKSALLDVNAIIVSGGIATQGYATTAASNAGSNALSAAQTYAASQASGALSSANGYTDTKAIATINTAQSYADSVSLTRANAAQTAAIASASSDATTKANAARTAAVSDSTALINSINIGAVNLQPNGRISSLDGFVNAQNISSLFVEAGNQVRIIGTNAGYLYFPYLSETLALTETVTLSLEVQNYSATTGLTIGISANGHSNVLGYVINPNLAWTKISATFLVSNGTTSPLARVLLECYGSSYNFAIRKIKLERGSKSTDWSPSVSDVDTSIATAQTAANNAQNAYNALTANLKSLAYQDVVELSKLGSTVISAGMIKTTLLDVSYIQANVVTASFINALDIVSKSIRTANSGTKRVEITQATNSLILYSASNEELVRIDDNLAIERYTLSGPIRGAGIRVGQEASYSASLSRFGFSNVVGSTGMQFIGVNPINGLGKVDLDVQDGFNIKNIEYSGGSPATLNRRVIAQEINVEGFSGIVLGLI